MAVTGRKRMWFLTTDTGFQWATERNRECGLSILSYHTPPCKKVSSPTTARLYLRRVDANPAGVNMADLASEEDILLAKRIISAAERHDVAALEVLLKNGSANVQDPTALVAS